MLQHYVSACLWLSLSVLSGCTESERGPQREASCAYQIKLIANSPNKLLLTNHFTGVLFDKAIAPSDTSSIAFTPTPEQVLLAESILQTCSGQNGGPWPTPVIPPGAIHALERYYRQYFGYRTRQGQTVIEINAFPNPTTVSSGFLSSWQQQRVAVEDGGKNYFSISIYLDTKECKGFTRNSIGG